MIGFCSTCEKRLGRTNKTGLCRPCFERRGRNNPPCIDCGDKTSDPRAKRCGACNSAFRSAAMKRMNADPAMLAKRVAGIKRAFRDPARLEANMERQRRAAKTRWANPEYAERVKQIMREQVQPKSYTQEAHAKRDWKAMGQKISDGKLPWCPREYRPLYRYWTNSRHKTAAEARKLVEAQMAADRPQTFEDKLKAVSEGRLSIYTLPGRQDWRSV